MKNNSHRLALIEVKIERGNTLDTTSFLLCITFNNVPVWFNLSSVTGCLAGSRNEGVQKVHLVSEAITVEGPQGEKLHSTRKEAVAQGESDFLKVTHPLAQVNLRDILHFLPLLPAVLI